MDQEYATIAEIGHNTSISAARENEEVHELSENLSYSIQLNHPNALKMEPNESYIPGPTLTVEVIQNEAYGVSSHNIDVSKNQAYIPVTAAVVRNITFSEVCESAEHSHDHDTDYYEEMF